MRGCRENYSVLFSDMLICSNFCTVISICIYLYLERELTHLAFRIANIYCNYRQELKELHLE